MIPVNRRRAHAPVLQHRGELRIELHMVLNDSTRSPATVFGLFCLEEVLGGRENQCQLKISIVGTITVILICLPAYRRLFPYPCLRLSTDFSGKNRLPPAI